MYAEILVNFQNNALNLISISLFLNKFDVKTSLPCCLIVEPK
jgi:hypothetical protein